MLNLFKRKDKKPGPFQNAIEDKLNKLKYKIMSGEKEVQEFKEEVNKKCDHEIKAATDEFENAEKHFRIRVAMARRKGRRKIEKYMDDVINDILKDSIR